MVDSSFLLRREVGLGLLMMFIFFLIYTMFFGTPASTGGGDTQKISAVHKMQLKQKEILLSLKKDIKEMYKEVSKSVNNPVSTSNNEQELDEILKKMSSLESSVAGNIEKIEGIVKDGIAESTKKAPSAGKPSVVVSGGEDENYRHIRLHELEKFDLNLEEVEPLPKPDKSEMSERWIVVTSIFGPTEDIKKLAKIPGWKMVVVGDKKSPKEYKVDNVVFLSVETQKKLGFETVKYLKYGVYQRKNMGYLYAIQHGAKYIYDTDDDNHPYGGKVVFDEMNDPKEYLMYHGGPDRHHYNGFAHMGQSTLWPRGFPLDMIDKHPVRKYKSCTKTRPLVQQGVVDGDPDLDAIQRLTRKDVDTKFVVYFDIDAKPVVFPPKSFCPFNSQNTFHHYDAFFSLLLPQTVTFRVNDIWRSFITQRLLWDVGGHLAYYPPNAYQDRTPHNFLTDFYEEEDLYKNTNPLTQFLIKWDSKSTDMTVRHFEIIKGMYKLDIIGALDVRLGRAWARDLKRIGYKAPKMQEATAECGDEVKEVFPKEMPTLFNRIGQKTVNVYEIAKKLPLTKERERDDAPISTQDTAGAKKTSAAGNEVEATKTKSVTKKKKEISENDTEIEGEGEKPVEEDSE